jgi:hypothetical protein
VLLNNVHLCLDIIPNLQQLVATMATMHWDFSNDLHYKIKRMQDRHDLDTKEFKNRNDDANEMQAVLTMANAKKELRRKKDEDAMIEFPEGRANFAEDESSFMSRVKKPEGMAAHVKEAYTTDKY